MKAKRRISKTTESQLVARPTTLSGLIPVLVVLLFLMIVRLRVADVPLERDEGEYAYSGQLILQGFPPYQFAYNMKFPGTYYAYSLILAMFGETAWGIHVGLLLVNAVTIVLLYFLAKHLLKDGLAATVASIAFGFLSLDRWIYGVFGHATHFVIFAAVAGLLVLCRALNSQRRIHFLIAGFLLGVSVLMKQNGIFFLGLGVGITIWNETQKSFRNLRSALRAASLVAIGSGIPFLILCLVLVAQGTLGKFWFWTFQYAREYVSRISISEAWGIFAGTVRYITRANLLIWILACVGAVLLWIVRWSKHVRIILTGLTVTSLLAVCPGFYFRNHYFILLLPAASLLCGVAVASVERLLSRITSGGAARAVAIAVFVAVVGAYVMNEWNYFFSISPIELSRSLYGSNPFVEAPEVANYVEAHTDSTNRIAVLGSEPEIYFYANRRSATGYIYMYPLMEQQKYSPRMQDEMIREITAAHPKYIVSTSVGTSWLVRNVKERVLTWSAAYLNQCYSVVGIAEIGANNSTRWFWDSDVAKYSPQSPNVVFTYKARADAPCAVTE